MNNQAVYPPPPWTLCGEAIIATRLVASQQVRTLVPPQLRIVPVLPGKTLAILAIIRYGVGSTLRYNELILAPALVEARGRIGSWISTIYVDNEASLLAGRAVWNLPKQLASFAWQSRSRVTVESEHMQVQIVANQHSDFVVPVPLLAPAFGTHERGPTWFMGKGYGRLGKLHGRIHVTAPEFSPLGFAELTSFYRLRRFRITLGSPFQL